MAMVEDEIKDFLNDCMLCGLCLNWNRHKTCPIADLLTEQRTFSYSWEDSEL